MAATSCAAFAFAFAPLSQGHAPNGESGALAEFFVRWTWATRARLECQHDSEGVDAKLFNEASRLDAA